jgi:hypothetical protein
MTTGKKFSRRQFLGASAAIAVGSLVAPGAVRRAAAASSHHLMWVWQFSMDGEPNVVGKRLQEYGLGILLKTHDGVTWMSEYDVSPYAVAGPTQVKVLSNYYEREGIPFHAWCVVHGSNPKAEARMAASVLDAGAHSLYLDVEPHPGFWQGSLTDAETFAKELRRLAPTSDLILSVDPRPWHLEDTPIAQFVPYVDAIAPQQYWSLFNSRSNYDRFAASGFPAPARGPTPEFLLDLSDSMLAGYGLPVMHVGPGNTPDQSEWQEFIDGAYGAGNEFVSVWRYGITEDAVFEALRNNPPRAHRTALSEGNIYIVRSGDTLSEIAETYGVTLEEIAVANDLSDQDYIYVGQELVVPGKDSAGAPG